MQFAGVTADFHQAVELQVQRAKSLLELFGFSLTGQCFKLHFRKPDGFFLGFQDRLQHPLLFVIRRRNHVGLQGKVGLPDGTAHSGTQVLNAIARLQAAGGRVRRPVQYPTCPAHRQGDDDRQRKRQRQIASAQGIQVKQSAWFMVGHSNYSGSA